MLTTADRPMAAESLAAGRLDDCVARAAAALLDAQRPDGHWLFELEADATIPAEYVLLRHYLGEPDDLALEARIGRYLRRVQGGHGGWPLFHEGAFDISASVKGYYALKMIGDDPAAPHMARAQAAILAAGGLAATNVFTRIQLALFGALPWDAVPEMPVELILLPRWFPVHLSKMSYWARTVVTPLLVLQALRPAARNPRGVRVDELHGGVAPARTRPGGRKRAWAAFWHLVDRGLRLRADSWPAARRRRAVDRCVAFVTERLNGEDGLGAIYPAMANSVMMFDALGYPPDHPHRALARRSVEKLLVLEPEDGEGDESYCQPCVSPVWDTALAAHALMEAGSPEDAVGRALDWLKPLQELEVAGDWAWRRPNLRPGGWAFQYANPHYPDVDDTAVVVMAMDRARYAYPEGLARAREWVEGMQSRGGGWGAFDADNFHDYLNYIPFADHGALLDPPTADVSARCVSMLAQLGVGREDRRMREALAYLEREQEADGSWYGRWGVNYVYGTWSALCALNAARLPPEAPAMRRGVAWLLSVQNPDGGWGEDCDSYALDYAGYHPHPSTASQTAWALLGLMAAGEVAHEAVALGIAWLTQRQAADGLWPQEHHSGGGFPRVFYLRYHGYPKYFPLWAVARYRNLMRSNTRRVEFGM